MLAILSCITKPSTPTIAIIPYYKFLRYSVTIIGPQFHYIWRNEVEETYGTRFAKQKIPEELIQVVINIFKFEMHEPILT